MVFISGFSAFSGLSIPNPSPKFLKNQSGSRGTGWESATRWAAEAADGRWSRWWKSDGVVRQTTHHRCRRRDEHVVVHQRLQRVQRLQRPLDFQPSSNCWEFADPLGLSIPNLPSSSVSIGVAMPLMGAEAADERATHAW